MQAEISMQLSDEDKSRRCAASRRGDLRFWLGQKMQNGRWSDPYSNETIVWDFQAFGARVFDTLVAQGPKSILASKSNSDTSCGVCMNINQAGSKRLQLKGLCPSIMRESIFDTEYYVAGLVNERLYFK